MTQNSKKHSHEHEVQVVTNDLYQILEYLWERIPNLEETVTTSGYKAVIETIILPDSLLAHPNPTIKSFIRDIMKLPSVLTAWYYGYKVGGTKYHYDEYLVAGAIFKPTCKIAFIFSTSEFLGIEISSRISNYLCEAPSRALTTISRQYQDMAEKNPDTMRDTNKFLFFIENLTLDLGFESILSSMIKTFTTDMLGKWYGDHIKIDTGRTLGNGHNIYEHAAEYWINNAHILDALPDILQKVIIQFAKGLVDTYSMTPPARIVEDIPHAVRHIGFLDEAQEFFHDSSALLQEWWEGDEVKVIGDEL